MMTLQNDRFNLEKPLICTHWYIESLELLQEKVQVIVARLGFKNPSVKHIKVSMLESALAQGRHCISWGLL